jgi:hypothetical protein
MIGTSANWAAALARMSPYISSRNGPVPVARIIMFSLSEVAAELALVSLI